MLSQCFCKENGIPFINIITLLTVILRAWKRHMENICCTMLYNDIARSHFCKALERLAGCAGVRAECSCAWQEARGRAWKTASKGFWQFKDAYKLNLTHIPNASNVVLDWKLFFFYFQLFNFKFYYFLIWGLAFLCSIFLGNIVNWVAHSCAPPVQKKSGYRSKVNTLFRAHLPLMGEIRTSVGNWECCPCCHEIISRDVGFRSQLSYIKKSI